MKGRPFCAPRRRREHLQCENSSSTSSSSSSFVLQDAEGQTSARRPLYRPLVRLSFQSFPLKADSVTDGQSIAVEIEPHNQTRVPPPRSRTRRLRLARRPAGLRCPRFQRLSGERKRRGSVSVKQGQGQERTFSSEDGGINKAAPQLRHELGEPQTPRGLVGNLRI